MTKTNEDHQPSTPSLRRTQRLERQARVGILRNPNHPPRPPLRKAALMGKWLSLRSTRRARADTVGARATYPDAPAAQPLASHSPSRVHTCEGLRDIDLVQLMKGARHTGNPSAPRSDPAGNRRSGPDVARTGPEGQCGLPPGLGVMGRSGPGTGRSQPARSDSLRPTAPETMPASDQIPPREAGRIAQGLVVVTGFGFLGIVALLFAGS